jgi:hypothetical protein
VGYFALFLSLVICFAVVDVRMLSAFTSTNFG